jgi:hypothetical protein
MSKQNNLHVFSAGAGCYFEADRRRSWDPIKEVLSATKKGETIDFIV